VVLCASPDTVREIMIAADALNFDNGEYVFFNIDLFARFVRLLRNNCTTAMYAFLFRFHDPYLYAICCVQVGQQQLRDHDINAAGCSRSIAAVAEIAAHCCTTRIRGSRLFKVTIFDTNRKPVFDLLLITK